MRNGCLLGLVLATVSAGCVLDDPDLGTDESEISVWQWTDDVQIPEQSSQFQVGLAPLGNKLHMLAANGSSGELYWSQFNGQGWTGRTPLGQYADYGPALTEHNGQLVTIYHRRGQNRLMMSTSNGETWSTPVTAGTSLGLWSLHYAPAVVSHDGELYVAYCRHSSYYGEEVRVDRLEGTSWRYAAEFVPPYGAECKHIAMASLPDGTLNVVWTQYKDNDWPTDDAWDVFEVKGSGPPMSSWPIRIIQPAQSKKPPSMVTCDGLTHLVHGGFSNPDEIWWAAREGGPAVNWTVNVKVPDQASSGGAALGCFDGTRTLMVHNGGTSQLWWSEFGD